MSPERQPCTYTPSGDECGRANSQLVTGAAVVVAVDKYHRSFHRTALCHISLRHLSNWVTAPAYQRHACSLLDLQGTCLS